MAWDKRVQFFTVESVEEEIARLNARKYICAGLPKQTKRLQLLIDAHNAILNDLILNGLDDNLRTNFGELPGIPTEQTT